MKSCRALAAALGAGFLAAGCGGGATTTTSTASLAATQGPATPDVGSHPPPAPRSTVVAGEPPPAPCTLLSTQDVSRAFGVEARPGKEQPDGSCLYQTGLHGLTVAITAAAPGSRGKLTASIANLEPGARSASRRGFTAVVEPEELGPGQPVPQALIIMIKGSKQVTLLLTNDSMTSGQPLMKPVTVLAQDAAAKL